MASRRRQRLAVDMDEMDRALSVAYRQAIKDDPCAYCGASGEVDDHVHPLSRGGTDHWWNLARACWPCNSSKGAKLLSEWAGRPDLLAQLNLDDQIGGAGSCDVDVRGEILPIGDR